MTPEEDPLFWEEVLESLQTRSLALDDDGDFYALCRKLALYYRAELTPTETEQ